MTNRNPSVSITGAPASIGEAIQVDLGTTSSDPAGVNDPLAFAWTVTKNSNPYGGGTSDSFSFTPDDNGTYVVSISVSDGDGGSATDSKTITVTNRNPSVGITGAPGTGKSRLISALIAAWRRRQPEKRVGVLAVDPSSPRSGGAVLGDRIRMMEHATDERVFIRSLSNRGRLGGLTLGIRASLRVMGLNPNQILIVPRVLGLTIAMPFLTMFANVSGLLGGLFVCILALDISMVQFFERVTLNVDIWDLWVGLIKAPVFAFLIAVTGTLRGMQVTGSAEELGRLTTMAVVQSIFLIIIADAFFTVLFSRLGI